MDITIGTPEYNGESGGHAYRVLITWDGNEAYSYGVSYDDAADNAAQDAKELAEALGDKTAQTVHNTSVETTTDGDGTTLYYAKCSCGWQSGTHKEEEAAQTSADKHEESKSKTAQSTNWGMYWDGQDADAQELADWFAITNRQSTKPSDDEVLAVAVQILEDNDREVDIGEAANELVSDFNSFVNSFPTWASFRAEVS